MTSVLACRAELHFRDLGVHIERSPMPTPTPDSSVRQPLSWLGRLASITFRFAIASLLLTRSFSNNFRILLLMDLFLPVLSRQI
jgi:hypothetical protein